MTSINPLQNQSLIQHELWHRGDLEFLTFNRPHGQNQLYNFIKCYKAEHSKDNTPIILECHRRLGKSFLALLYLTQECLKYPGTIAMYGAPYHTQVNEIVLPNFNVITQFIPPSLKPRKNKNKFYFKNPRWPEGSLPSCLTLAGCNIDNGDRLRGPALDICALDEVRDIPNLSYIVKDVLSYQFVGRPRPTLIMTTTPPESMAHEFITEWVPKSINQGTYRVMPVSRNPDFTKEDEKIVLDIVGSKDSIGWRREAECEHVDDEQMKVLPDFSDKNIQQFDNAEHYRPLVCVDFGYFPDYTALLFGYVDYQKQILYVIDECVVRAKSTGEIMKLAKEKEAIYFADKRLKVSRFGDNSKQQLADLANDHDFYVTETEKWDRDRWIAELNTRIKDGKIVIHPRCVKTILQCKHASWDRDNKRRPRKEFIRNEELGHCDAVACLVYLSRMAPWHENPYPDKTYNSDKQWVNPDNKTADKKLVEAFRPTIRRTK